MHALALWRKNTSEALWLFLSLAVGLFVFCWVRVWITSLLDMTRFQNVVEQFRQFEHLSPIPFDQIVTWPGRVSMLFDEPLVWGQICIWALARGSDAVSGEINRGTMEMLLAQPVSRFRVLATQVAVTLLGLALLVLAASAGTAVGLARTQVKVEDPPPKISVPLPFVRRLEIPLGTPQVRKVPLRELVSHEELLPGSLNLFALGVFVTGLTTFLSACDRYRWRTLGLAAGVCAVSMVLKIVGRASKPWSWLLYGTFFTAYEPQTFVLRGVKDPAAAWAFWVQNPSTGITEWGPLSYDMLLVSLGAVGCAAAAVVFCRRDLPAPL